MKNTDITKKVIILQASWVRKLYDNCFHEWKLIPFHLIAMSVKKSFKFHLDLPFKTKIIEPFPSFYRQILLNLSTASKITSSAYGIINIYWEQVGNNPIHFMNFSEKNINSWKQPTKSELFSTVTNYTFDNRKLEQTIIQNNCNADDFLIHDHHLLRGFRILAIGNRTSKKIYVILTFKVAKKPS